MKKEIVETFQEVRGYYLSRLILKEPSCINGNVRIKKYRIIVEEIKEDKEVLCARLQKLWEECDNWHHWTPLKAVAKKLNYEFTNEVGCKRKRK